VDAADHVLVEIGRRVRAARNAAKMSQQAAAIAAGSDYRWWQRLEQGQVNPTVRTLVKVAAALRVSVADFFSDRPRTK
jgi:transcriptional regulator with XRE-family HTH domain